ncbi:RDD family protein [Falsiroseomonas sp.]|uniref:RDD family protein n=1 Tax=Falsiroseomonas sp. TaxID=2870721 RepID=UPI0027172594|nr:RDD family protein [Falsiroseomonas sp.]MDO9500944.1 RDD family protein [Falsiroseomonas sp.]MDP3414965.1 RDD family protein [Falsiroseomonas sp.]
MMPQQGVELASFGRRLAAQLLDLLWLMPLSVLLGTIGALANGGELSLGGEMMANVIGTLIVLLFWLERQGTPGKLVLGLRIVDAETGLPPRFGALVLRYLGYLISALPLCLGYFWMLWDPRRQTWHDKMGRTLVVQLPQGSSRAPNGL